MKFLVESHNRLIRCGSGSGKKICRVRVFFWRYGLQRRPVAAKSDWAAMVAAASAELASATAADDLCGFLSKAS